MIEVFAAVIGDDRHPTVPGGVVVALDAPYRRGAATVGKPGQDALDILSGTALHREPPRPIGNLQQTMVVAKARETAHRKGKHRAGRAGPDRRGHRQQIAIAKRCAVSVGEQPLAKRHGRFG